jgi:hypothetical protein
MTEAPVLFPRMTDSVSALGPSNFTATLKDIGNLPVWEGHLDQTARRSSDEYRADAICRTRPSLTGVSVLLSGVGTLPFGGETTNLCANIFAQTNKFLERVVSTPLRIVNKSK